MGAKNGKLYTSSVRNTYSEACKALETKLMVYEKTPIVTLADETIQPILSPRGSGNRLAIARVRGRDHNVKFKVTKDGITASIFVEYK